MAIVYDLAGAEARASTSWRGRASSGQRTSSSAELKEVTAEPDDTEADREDRLRELAEARYYPIFVVGSTYAGAVAKVAPEYPGIWFGIVDDGSVDGPKVIGIQFHEEQGSFLVGAAAALTSKTGNVGFVGAVQSPVLQKFEAGFTAGAGPPTRTSRSRSPTSRGRPPTPASGDPAKARKAALGMYDAGADVIFGAAATSGNAVIQAAHDRGLWAIGVDSDQYLMADPSVRGAILTSMLKRADVATYMIAMEVANGVAKDGNNVFGVGRGRRRLLDLRRLRRPDQGAARCLRRQDRLGRDPGPHERPDRRPGWASPRRQGSSLLTIRHVTFVHVLATNRGSAWHTPHLG